MFNIDSRLRGNDAGFWLDFFMGFFLRRRTSIWSKTRHSRAGGNLLIRFIQQSKIVPLIIFCH